MKLKGAARAIHSPSLPPCAGAFTSSFRIYTYVNFDSISSQGQSDESVGLQMSNIPIVREVHKEQQTLLSSGTFFQGLGTPRPNPSSKYGNGKHYRTTEQQSC